MGRIPNTESKASWMIKQKTQKPESAMLHATLYAAPSNAVSKAQKQEDWYIRVAKRGYQEDMCTGRQPGSRVVWNEELEIYVLLEGGDKGYHVSGQSQLACIR